MKKGINGKWTMMVIGLSFIIYHLSFSHAVAQDKLYADEFPLGDVTLLDGRTKAEVTRINATLSGDLSVTAQHKASLHTLTVTADVGGVGAGIGLNIDVIQDESDVAAVKFIRRAPSRSRSSPFSFMKFTDDII